MIIRPVTPKGTLPLITLALSLLVLAVYWQVGGHAFINFDDPPYVSENPQVLRGFTREGVAWAFTTFIEANWHPLTWLSHMTDVELFGPAPGWHHRINALFHLANTVLLFLVLWRMTAGLWQSAFVAALFGVHPLHVESVAWLAERKDVLSTLFWLLTMAAYLRFVRKPGAGGYLPVAVFFALGLMCKPMLVTLPFVLLLLDWWPLGRMSPEGSRGSGPWRISLRIFSRRVWEKAPLLGLSVVSCVITYVAQARGHAVSSLTHIPLGLRVSNAAASYVVYLGKTVWPASLAVFYPHPASLHADIPSWQTAGAVLLLGGLSFLALREGHRRPYLAVGWLWYVGTLVPVIGLVQVGMAAHADRYTYVPLIGLFIAVGWGIPELFSGWSLRRAGMGALGGAAVVALSVAAGIQVGYWRDSVTLFSRTLAVTERNWMANGLLGMAREEQGNPREAIAYYREALRVNPDFADAWYNLGVAYGKIGQQREAIDCYREALRIHPAYVRALYNLGLTYARLGQLPEAIDHFKEAVRVEPNFAEAWNNLGLAQARLGRLPEAIDHFKEAGRVKPNYSEASYNLGLTYARLGRLPEAIDHFKEAVRSRPGYAEALYNLGLAYEQLGQREQADAFYGEAQRVRK